jgi:hypothetical protein
MRNLNLTTQSLGRQCPPIRNYPVDARAYLRDLSFLAHEVATSSDPRVIAGGLEVLALQAEFLAAAARGAK